MRIVTTGVFRDTIHDLRSWRRTPGSALFAVLALGLSGGALITLVSLFNALFWRELPVSHPDELVRLSAVDSRDPDWRNPVIPVSLFASVDRAQTVFQAFAGFQSFESTAVITNTTHQLAIDVVSGRYFEALGVRPALGEVVGAREVDSASPVATISFRCWQTRFGADPSVVGQSFRLGGELVTVIGVAPAAFAGLEVGCRPTLGCPRRWHLACSECHQVKFSSRRSADCVRVSRSNSRGLRSNRSGRGRAKLRPRTWLRRLAKRAPTTRSPFSPTSSLRPEVSQRLDTERAIGAL